MTKHRAQRKYMSKHHSVKHTTRLDSELRDSTLTVRAIRSTVAHCRSIHGFFHIRLVIGAFIRIPRVRSCTLLESFSHVLGVKST